ncbi:MAG: histidine phosphatase family protein [Actinomycetaceae bacterium]|nr:histidine phosphatase family protein [Actinomycetaceae bacterium]
MKRTTVHLMRHGEVHNPDGILYGRLPGYRLSELGTQMVQMTADHLKTEGHDIRRVVASPLLRAQESAAPSAKVFGLSVESDERLIESGNSFEGFQVNANRLALAHPRFWWRYRNPFTPSWGEPYIEMLLRMRSAIISAINKAEGGEVLLVSHQLPIWVVRRYVEGQALAHSPNRRQCALASLTSLTFLDHTLVGLSYAEPAKSLMAQAIDMVPGTSAAGANRG